VGENLSPQTVRKSKKLFNKKGGSYFLLAKANTALIAIMTAAGATNATI
jgi:hypothetical protein